MRAAEPHLAIEGAPQLLSQVVANMLDNSLSHRPPGTSVELTARTLPGGVTIVIGDDGPGAVPEDRERLFNRFARGERARSTARHGPGLSMVKAIAAAHGGTAAILERRRFALELRLPLRA